MDKKNTTPIWIKLAISDLKSSRILYEQRQFRTSYFFFQQATEKANKAFALKFGTATEENLKDAGHDQFKIDRKYLVKKMDELKNSLDIATDIPVKLSIKHERLTNAVKSIDGLRNEDLINISNKDLLEVYKEIKRFAIPINKRYPQIKEIFKKTEESKRAKLIGEFLLEQTRNIYFIKLTLYACALLTIKHSSLTRYPQDNLNPIKLYNAKLPIIKRQSDFMDLLEEAIGKLNKYNTSRHFDGLFKKLESLKVI